MDRMDRWLLYKVAVNVLREHLTCDQFLQLDEELDGDPDNEFFSAIRGEAAKLAPELFGRREG